jgi:hypothetical protein
VTAGVCALVCATAIALLFTPLRMSRGIPPRDDGDISELDEESEPAREPHAEPVA